MVAKEYLIQECKKYLEQYGNFDFHKINAKYCEHNGIKEELGYDILLYEYIKVKYDKLACDEYVPKWFTFPMVIEHEGQNIETIIKAQVSNINDFTKIIEIRLTIY